MATKPEQQPDLICADCQKRIPSDEYGLYDNVLGITFDGGYGWFIDYSPIFGDEAPPRAHLCHECAHHLCDTHPWIANLLKPYDSHSHRSGSVGPEHKGWDLETKT